MLVPVVMLGNRSGSGSASWSGSPVLVLMLLLVVVEEIIVVLSLHEIMVGVMSILASPAVHTRVHANINHRPSGTHWWLQEYR